MSDESLPANQYPSPSALGYDRPLIAPIDSNHFHKIGSILVRSFERLLKV